MTVTPAPSGGPDADLKRVLEAFEARTVIVETLAEEVTSLVTEVRGLRTALAHRPARGEVERKRRMTALLVALWSLILIFAHDNHVERCSPGARASFVVDAFLAGEDNFDRLREVGRANSPFLCDVAFPLHSHSSLPVESAAASVLGLTMYAGLFGGGLYWATHPGGRTRREEAEERAEVAAATDTRTGRGPGTPN